MRKFLICLLAVTFFSGCEGGYWVGARPRSEVPVPGTVTSAAVAPGVPNPSSSSGPTTLGYVPGQ